MVVVRVFYWLKRKFLKPNALYDEYIKIPIKDGLKILGTLFGLFSFLYIHATCLAIWLGKTKHLDELITAVVVFAIIAFCLVKLGQVKEKKVLNQIAQVKERIQDLRKELHSYYTTYEDCPIGEEYTDPNTLAAIQKN